VWRDAYGMQSSYLYTSSVMSPSNGAPIGNQKHIVNTEYPSSPAWTNTNGWNQAYHAQTIQTFKCRGKLYLIARNAANGILTYRAKFYNRNDTINSQILTWEDITASAGYVPWNNEAGFTDNKYWSTITPVSGGDQCALVARTPLGIETWSFEKDEKWIKIPGKLDRVPEDAKIWATNNVQIGYEEDEEPVFGGILSFSYSEHPPGEAPIVRITNMVLSDLYNAMLVFRDNDGRQTTKK